MKKRHRENVRVVATAYAGFRHASISEADWADRQVDAAEALVKSVRRHCDEIDGIRVVFDTVYRCEHCAYEWEPSFDGPAGPCCCDAAVQEWKAV